MAKSGWTFAQVSELAPDNATVVRAQDLAAAGKWQLLQKTSETITGRISGREGVIYQVSVNLAGEYLRCSCPSRNQPCKHALGLLLLWTQEPTVFDQG